MVTLPQSVRFASSQQRVALSQISGGPWAGLVNLERCPSLASRKAPSLRELARAWRVTEGVPLAAVGSAAPYGGAFHYGKACAFWLLQSDYSEDFQFVIRLSADYLNIVAAGGYL